MFVIKYRGNYLDGFYPNDLPTRTKNGVSIKNIFTFSRKNYSVFESFNEAKEYLHYILNELHNENNIKRWNQVHWYAEEALINVYSKMKIVEYLHF